MEQIAQDRTGPTSIWFGGEPSTLFLMGAPGLVSHIGIELLEFGPDFLKGRMPVDERTRQPFGLLHGGASVVLAETLASVSRGRSTLAEPPMCGTSGSPTSRISRFASRAARWPSSTRLP